MRLTLLWLLTLNLLGTSVVRAESSVDFINKHAIAIASALEFPESVFDVVKDYKAILIGELHGTNESPDLTMGLLKLLAAHHVSLLLGIEYLADEQSAIDSFLKTGDPSPLKGLPSFISDYQDGKTSRAMVALINTARGLNIPVACFDSKASSDDVQNREMAQNLNHAFLKSGASQLVVLTGNLHSPVIPIPWQGKAFQPMGYELTRVPNSPFNPQQVLSLRFRYHEGTSWNCSGPMADTCGLKQERDDESDYSKTMTRAGHYFLKEIGLVDGHNGTLFSRKISASSPYLP